MYVNKAIKKLGRTLLVSFSGYFTGSQVKCLQLNKIYTMISIRSVSYHLFNVNVKMAHILEQFSFLLKITTRYMNTCSSYGTVKDTWNVHYAITVTMYAIPQMKICHTDYAMQMFIGCMFTWIWDSEMPQGNACLRTSFTGCSHDHSSVQRKFTCTWSTSLPDPDHTLTEFWAQKI